VQSFKLQSSYYCADEERMRRTPTMDVRITADVEQKLGGRGHRQELTMQMIMLPTLPSSVIAGINR